MKKSDITRTVFDIKFLTFFFLVLSFLPLEATCVPGNIMLFISPFIILFIRHYYTMKITRNDLLYACIFVVMILFVTALAMVTNCVKTYGVTQEIPHEWKTAVIDSIDANGLIYVKNIRTIPIDINEIDIFVDGFSRKCVWNDNYFKYIAPNQIRPCNAGVVCTGTTTVELFTPGNNDTAVC